MKGFTNDQSNWVAAPIILISIFSGSNTAGHWSYFVSDRLTNLKELMLYADSLSPHHLSQDLQQLLGRDGCCIMPGRPDVEWVVASSPGQAGSDCAVHTCIKFLAYLKALRGGTLYRYDPAIQHPEVKFELSNEYTLQDWGQLGRRHLLTSLCRGTIDLDDQVVQNLTVTHCHTTNETMTLCFTLQ